MRNDKGLKLKVMAEDQHRQGNLYGDGEIETCSCRKRKILGRQISEGGKNQGGLKR